MLDDQSVEYGFLLHDIGKIGIPDDVLRKPGHSAHAERRVMETHTILGEQILARVPLLHERGPANHPLAPRTLGRHRLSRPAQARRDPACARIFAVADALDAMTTDRPYRKARTWNAAVEEIVGQAGQAVRPHRGRRVPELRAAAETDLLRARRSLEAQAAGAALEPRAVALRELRQRRVREDDRGAPVHERVLRDGRHQPLAADVEPRSIRGGARPCPPAASPSATRSAGRRS